MRTIKNQAMNTQRKPKDREPISGHTVGALKRKINSLERANATLRKELDTERDQFQNYRKEVRDFVEYANQIRL